MKKCPCCSNRSFSECCEPFLVGKKIPGTPEELMRSRYSAYATGLVDYIEPHYMTVMSPEINLTKWPHIVKRYTIFQKMHVKMVVLTLKVQ